VTADKDTWSCMEFAPPPLGGRRPGTRRQRADVVFTETGKLPVKFDYRTAP